MKNFLIKFESHPNLHWSIWVVSLLIVLLIQLITIDDLLLIYKDQVQITDYGRLTLDPKSNWSLTWRIGEEKPLLLWSYIGPLIAELSYYLSGSSGIGSRIASLLGGMFAATMAFGWLKSRKVPVYAAYFLGLAFLIDPLFVLSQRLGRMDSWVIGLCLAACWILSLASQKEKLHKISFFISGGLAIIAGFTWPSAIFLYPLIVVCFLPSISENGLNAATGRRFILQAAYFLLGGIITGFLFLIPIWENIEIIFGDMSSVLSKNTDSTNGWSYQILKIFDLQLWLKLIKAFVKTLSIFLPLLAIVAIIFKRDKKFIFALLMSILAIFISLIYELRALYLLPYFLVLASSLFDSKELLSFKYVKYIRKAGLSILVIWAVGISLIVRTVIGASPFEESYQTKIYREANASIGSGAYKVFLGFNYEFYFAGRALNWHLYSPYVNYEYDDKGNWISDSKYEPEDKFVHLLSNMDYAIFKPKELDSHLEEQIAAAGLVYKQTLVLDSLKTNDDYEQKGTREIILWYLAGNDTQNRYNLYSRNKSPLVRYYKN